MLIFWGLYHLKYVHCEPFLGSQSISSVGCQTYGKTKRNTHKKEIKHNVFKFRVCESTYEFWEASGSEKKKTTTTKESHWGILRFQRQQPKNKQTKKQVFLWLRGRVFQQELKFCVACRSFKFEILNLFLLQLSFSKVLFDWEPVCLFTIVTALCIRSL